MATDVKLSSEFTIIYGGEVIAYCTDFQLEKNKEIIDITKLGDTWKNKKVDTKDFNVSFNGMITRGDTITASLWDSTTAYSSGDYVVLGGKAWEAQGSTTGDNPTTDDGTHWLETSEWLVGTTYAADDLVYITSVAAETRIYKSLQGSNVGNDPLTETAYWERLETNYESLLKELANNDTAVECAIKPTTSGETYYYGDGVLTSISASITQGDKATFSGSFSGSGSLSALSGYDTDYETVYNTFTTKPSTTQAEAQNTLVTSLKQYGIWTKLDTFQLYAVHTNNNDEGLINWIDPGTNDPQLSTPIVPTFAADEGFTGDSNESNNVRIQTNFIPSAASKYALNSASFGVYVRTYVAGTDCIVGVDDDTNFSQILQQYTLINSLVNTGIDPEDYGFTAHTGLLALDRPDSTQFNKYRNGVLDGNHTDPSSALPTAEMYVLAQNDVSSNDNNFAGQVSCFFAGESLTATQHLNLFSAIETYLAAL